jgi:endonuclease/exonuclease/phosphatase (EEP) superfamily protein YafD
MALHQKWDYLLALQPDIAIVPESARPNVLANRLGSRWAAASGSQWVGMYEHKGLGVYSFGEWHLGGPLEGLDQLQWVMAVPVQGPVSFMLLAVWAMNHRARSSPPGIKPGRQVQLALESDALRSYVGPLVVAGDFNDNVRWKPRGHGDSMANCVTALEARRLRSCYHERFGVNQGEEEHPTMLWSGAGESLSGYHIDYVWASSECRIEEMRVGNGTEWNGEKISDHFPLEVDLIL